MGRFQHGVPCTWQLPWLAVVKPWSALAGPFLTLLAQTGSGTTPLGENMQFKNEFHLEPNSYFVRKLHWTRGVTLNHGKRRWATAWNKMNPECN